MTALLEHGRREREGDEAERPGARRLQLALLAVPVVVFGLQAWGHRWMTDDGFINLRVVSQIEAGHGPVFNAGERVEAFTSPLWIALLTLGDVVLPVRLEWVAVALGIALSVAGLALAIAGSARLWARPPGADARAPLVPVGALVALALYPMWYFASSGLEGGLVFAWEGACLFLLARLTTQDGPPARWVAVVLGLGWLIRPELALMTVAFLGAVAAISWSRVPRRRLVSFVLVALALPAAYQLFRMGFYGSIVPNTALAKEASTARWGRGWDYLRDLVDTYSLWVPVVLLLAAGYVPLLRHLSRHGRGRATPVVVAFAAGSALCAVYIVRVGGDYIHARLLLPSLFAFCAPVAVVRMQGAAWAGLLVLPWAAYSALSYSPVVEFRTALDGRTNLVTAEEVLGRYEEPLLPWFTGDGVYWEDRPLPGEPGPDVVRPTVARLAIGLPSYVLGPDVDVFDTLGLADPLTARFALARPGVPGHEKPIPPAWAAARLTAPGAAVEAERLSPGGFGFVVPLVPPASGAAFERQVAQVRRGLECAEVEELRDATNGRLDAARFLDNLVFSLSSVRLEIPPDPAEAERALC
ncbi:terminal beta-(1-_2)-arabinofuranosyltransferase [soil metagenome]